MATTHRRAESIVTRSKEIIARLREKSPVAAAVAAGVAEAAGWAITASEAVIGFEPVSAADALLMTAGTLKAVSETPVPNDYGRFASRCAATACCFAVTALRDRRTLREAEAQIEQAEAFAALAGAGGVVIVNAVT